MSKTTTGAFSAGADLVRYDLCQISGGALIKTTGPTDQPIGSVENGYANGEEASLLIEGRGYLIAGDTVTAGSLLMADAVTAGTVLDHDGVAGNYIVGLALESGTAGDYVDCLIWAQGTKQS